MEIDSIKTELEWIKKSMEELHPKVDATYNQAKQTNGRVSKLEDDKKEIDKEIKNIKETELKNINSTIDKIKGAMWVIGILWIIFTFFFSIYDKIIK